MRLTKLIYGDCLEVMKSIPDASIDAIITDPPYGTTACKWDSIIPFEPMWEQLNRIIKPNGAIVFFASQPFTSALIMSNIKFFRYTWIWEKSKATGFLNSKIRPLIAHEDIVVFSKKKPIYNPRMINGTLYNKGIRKKQTDNDVYGSYNQVEVKSKGKRYPRSVLYFKTAESEGKTFHKTQKPIKLMEYFIKTYTNEGETVLDFTMGSGTTMVACENTNRRGIGIENDRGIFDIAVNRMTTHKQ